MRKDNPAQFKKQRLLQGIFEKLVDVSNKTKTVKSYTEYDNTYFTVGKTPPKELSTIILDRFLNFHPKTNPVHWRILITQALLYDALKNIRKNKTTRQFIKTLSDMRDSSLSPQEVSSKWRETRR